MLELSKVLADLRDELLQGRQPVKRAICGF
jgi:hypothetical protein